MRKQTRWALLCVLVAALSLMAWDFTPRASSHDRQAAPGKLSPAASSNQPGVQNAPAEEPSLRTFHPSAKGGAKVSPTPLFKSEESDEDDPNSDPDLPPGMSGHIDKEAYLRARADYIDMKRGRPFDLPYDPREKAIEQMDRQETSRNSLMRRFGLASLLSSMTWTHIGPSPIPNGQTSAVSMPVSGRTIAIAVHPTDPDTVYVGTAQGGLYKSTNGGTNWTPLFDFQLESLAIGAITIDPTDSSIVYIGTGEPNLSADSFAGRGLYIIRNANSPSPSLTGPFRLNGAGSDIFTGRAIGRVAVSSTDNNVIYVSTTSGTGGNPNTTPATLPNRGLYRSTNAQSATPTFEQVQVTGVPLPNDRTMVDVVLDPANSNLLLVTVIGASGDGGIYRTANALDPAPAFTRTLTLADGTTNGRAELTVTRNATQGTTFYTATGEIVTSACTGNNATRGGAARKSTDGGLTWSSPMTGSAGFCGGQCFYDIAIAVTPDNQTIHLGGAARSGTAGICNIDVMKRSVNGGASFARNDTGLHADEHVLAVSPSNPNVVYTGSDGGIWRSVNNGTNWTSLNNSDFSATQFQSLALHPFDRYISIGGTQDNGTNCLAPDGTTWTNCQGGDGGYALIDSNAQDISNVTAYHTFFNQTTTQIRFERTLTNSYAWTSKGCQNGVSNNGIGCGNAVLFYAPMELGPGNPNTVYFGTDRLYRSTNRGDTMTLASQGPLVPVSATQGVVLTTIGVSRQDDNVRIVGLRNGQVFATTTGNTTLTDVTGANFPAPNPADPARKSIGRAIIDPNNKFTAYVTFTSFGVPAGQHIFKTTNLNDPVPTWTVAGNGIPDVPVSSLVVDPQNSDSLYAGTDIGVYHSSDGGASWAPFGTGLPRVAVFDMKISNVQRILRIATHGRGIYEISIPGQQLPIIRGGSAAVVAEGCAPGNGAIDPGEDVTISFSVRNIGAGPTTNLTAMLLSGPNVTPGGQTTQSYGEIASGSAESREFQLTAGGNCGDTITLTFHLQDGDTDYGNATVQFSLGRVTSTALSENFDATSVPALPAGWTTAHNGSLSDWATAANVYSDTLPNVAAASGSDVPGDNRLDSPAINIPALPGYGTNPAVQLSFRNNYLTEAGFDGGVLEISINGGAFQDIIAAGGTFASGGYNGTIGVTDSVLTGRQAWTGNSLGFVTTVVNLPASARGQSARFRWRTAYDTGTNPPGGGMRIDTVSVYAATTSCCTGPCVLNCPTNIEVSSDAGACGAIVNYPMPTYTGNCGTVTASQASGTFFPVGTTTVTITGTRLDGSTDSCSFTVTVKDTEPPSVTAVTVDTPSLWPANHQMVDVTLNYKAVDNCGVNCTPVVTSNEPINGLGDGDTAPDWEVVDDHHVRLRAERSGKGNGRIYTITITCKDNAGNTIVRTVTVTVPKSQSGK